jgi:hypothetical protein
VSRKGAQTESLPKVLAGKQQPRWVCTFFLLTVFCWQTLWSTFQLTKKKKKKHCYGGTHIQKFRLEVTWYRGFWKTRLRWHSLGLLLRFLSLNHQAQRQPAVAVTSHSHTSGWLLEGEWHPNSPGAPNLICTAILCREENVLELLCMLIFIQKQIRRKLSYGHI